MTQPKLVCSFGKTQRANAINIGVGEDLTIKYSPAPARHLSLDTRHFFSAFQPSQILQEVVHRAFRPREALGHHVKAGYQLPAPLNIPRDVSGAFTSLRHVGEAVYVLSFFRRY